MEKLIVALGSRNPVKIRGTEKAFRSVFSDRQVVVVPTDAVSGVEPQPIGLDRVVEGARNRAVYACRSVEEAEFCVGIEAGLFVVGGQWLDTQVAYVLSRDGCVGIGFSPSFPVPRRFVARILGEGLELEQVVDEAIGTRGIGEKEGFVHVVTGGRISREELVYLAVVMALAPWIRRDLFR